MQRYLFHNTVSTVGEIFRSVRRVALQGVACSFAARKRNMFWLMSFLEGEEESWVIICEGLLLNLWGVIWIPWMVSKFTIKSIALFWLFFCSTICSSPTFLSVMTWHHCNEHNPKFQHLGDTFVEPFAEEVMMNNHPNISHDYIEKDMQPFTTCKNWCRPVYICFDFIKSLKVLIRTVSTSAFFQFTCTHSLWSPKLKISPKVRTK